MPAHAARFDLAGPAREERLAHAAFREIALLAGEPVIRLEKRDVMPAFLVRPIVAREKDNRVFIEPQRLQLRKHCTDLIVHKSHHARKPLLHIRPVLARELPIARRLQPMPERRVPLARLVVRVRQIQRVVEEERLPLFLPALIEPALHIVREKLRRPLPAALARRHAGACDFPSAARDDVIVQRHALPVADEEVRVAIVRMRRVHIAEEMIEALLVRIVRRQRQPEPVLADAGRRVARAFQQPRHREIRVRHKARPIPPDAAVPRMQPREQHAARRRTHRAARIVPREFHPLRRHAIEIRRGEHLLPVAPEIAIARIVHEDVDDVRPRRLRRVERGKWREQREQQRGEEGGGFHRAEFWRLPCNSTPREKMTRKCR